MPEIITSRDNPKIKTAVKVREMRQPGLIFIEGLRLAEEALKSGHSIKEAFYTRKIAGNDRGAALLNQLEHHIEVSEKVLDHLSDTKQSQGIVFIVEKPATGKERMGSKPSGLFLMLHEINNPSNLGAILRTAEAAGVAGIILTQNSADAFSPKALRGSMGACLRLPIWEGADFEEAVEWAKSRKIKTIACDVSGEKNYIDVDWSRASLLVLGSEAHGLGKEQLELIDETIVIPMENSVESLNVGVAAGIILFEAKRHRN